eukprot:RCo003749
MLIFLFCHLSLEAGGEVFVELPPLWAGFLFLLSWFFPVGLMIAVFCHVAICTEAMRVSSFTPTVPTVRPDSTCIHAAHLSSETPILWFHDLPLLCLCVIVYNRSR